MMGPVFFLGGRDLEMETIRALVEETLGTGAVRDHGLGWGARLSDYAADLAALPPSAVPVLVELVLDIPVPADAVVIDHHGTRAGADAPTSLEQVFRLLALPAERWNRHLALVAANDRGHVRALRAMGATVAEIDAIRAADRRAQGITEAEEAAGEAALAASDTRLDGALTVIRLPHARTAVAMDRLAAATADDTIDNVLVFAPGEVDFFGIGAAVAALDTAFPGGWSGGDLPEAGFWWHGEPLPDEDVLVDVLTAILAPRPPGP
jgi:hypothetical protein